MESLFEHVWVGHPALLFFGVEPLGQGQADDLITGYFFAPARLHPIQIAMETLQERVG